MSDALLSVPVCLVGMPGCGKTTLGKELAKKLGAGFVDSDREIERRIGDTVTSIFKKEGEAGFRLHEYNVIKDMILQRPARVIASGGGAFVQDKTRLFMQEHSVTLWLKPSLDLIYRRVSRKNTRPLLETHDKHDTIEKMAEQRYPFYSQAHMVLEDTACEEAPHAYVAEQLREMLRTYTPSPLHLE